MLYKLYTPTTELADIVSCYWYVDIESNSYSMQRYTTPLFEELVFNFTKLKEFRYYEGKTVYMDKMAYILGQTTSCSIISGNHEKSGYVIGVRFKPLGIAKITGINMADLTNKNLNAEDIMQRIYGAKNWNGCVKPCRKQIL